MQAAPLGAVRYDALVPTRVVEPLALIRRQQSRRAREAVGLGALSLLALLFLNDVRCAAKQSDARAGGQSVACQVEGRLHSWRRLRLPVRPAADLAHGARPELQPARRSGH